jgi:glycosyltransferase involved in cell wall biosynthesis
MQVTFIACPFTTSYGAASESLKKALEKKLGRSVDWVASNCGCDDEAELGRQFQMQGCKYFDMITISDYQSSKRWKFWLRIKARKLLYYFRAQKYRKLSAGAEVVNFQQTLHAYGSTVLFHWLNQRSQAARVVTVHELDRHQLENPARNKIYNKADAIIVQQGAMKEQLVGLGVDRNKIEIVLHGTELPAMNGNEPREGIVFYGGHHPLKGKGLHAVFQAMTMLKTRLGPKAPKLKVHGYFGRDDLATVKELAAQAGLADDTSWFMQLPLPEAFRLYHSSLLCVLPYMGSFAGLAAATAAAAELPIVGTRNAGIPEHIGENGLWIDNDNPQQIVAQVETLLGSEELRRDLAARLRKRAEQDLSWDVVADKTLAVYRRALRQKMG